MWDPGAWLVEVFTWRVILLVIQWQAVTSIEGSSEVVVPGTGHVQRLPHSLKPSLQDTRSVLLYHRYQRDGYLSRARNRHIVLSKPDNIFGVKTWSTISDQEQKSERINATSDFNHFPSLSNASSISTSNIKRSAIEHYKKSKKMFSGFEKSTLVDPDSDSSRSRQRRDQPSLHNNITDDKNVNATNATFIPNGDESKGISDKEIIIIVVCASIGLVICFLGAALFAKFYWHKMRDDGGAGYQGVLQKDISEGNSPCDDEPTGIQITPKEKDARIHSNMFAQIDEIDEDNCSTSPATKSRRHSSMQNGVSGGDEGEMKPLLPHSIPMPSLKMDDNDSKLSEIDASDGNSSEKKDDDYDDEDNDGDDDDDIRLVSEGSNAEFQKNDFETAQVHVEADGPGLDGFTEPRLYCRTGLSQSDYSLSSFTSVNPSYRYGNQVGYMGGYYGYPSVDVTSPEGDDADDQLLLPPPADFDLQPLDSLAFEAPAELEDVPSKECIALEESIAAVPVSREEESSAEMESPLDFEDDVLSNSVGQLTDPVSTAVDNESDFSLGVNVDEGDVADCGACDEEEDPVEVMVVDAANGTATKCNGKKAETPKAGLDGIGPSASLPVKINTDSNVQSHSNTSKTSDNQANVSATAAMRNESTVSPGIKSDNNSISINNDSNSIAVT